MGGAISTISAVTSSMAISPHGIAPTTSVMVDVPENTRTAPAAVSNHAPGENARSVTRSIDGIGVFGRSSRRFRIHSVRGNSGVTAAATPTLTLRFRLGDSEVYQCSIRGQKRLATIGTMKMLVG